MNHAKRIKKLLLQDIDDMICQPDLYAKDPARDFTRNRKFPIRNVLLFQIGMERDTMNRELLKYFNYAIDTPSASAFYQQRRKLHPDTFRILFKRFNSHFKPTLLKQKYVPIAVDGTAFNMFRDPTNMDTFRPPSGQSKLGYSEIYVVGAYQLLDKVFSDAVIKPSRIKNEYTAICEMIDRCDSSQGIPLFLADRGFPSFNCFAHAKETGVKYLIRAKDLYVDRLLRDERPDTEEFDVTIDRIIVRHNSRKQYAHPERMHQYRRVDPYTSFDFIEYGERDEYELTIRVIRIKINDDTYENLITNLSPEEFPKEALKDLYHLRWDEEISFRELKHIIGAIDFHSKSVENVTHELWARLLLYNFCSQITSLVVIRQKSRKHQYQVNFTMAYQTCREFLRRTCKDPPVDVLQLIAKYILPIRPGREYERNKLFQRPMTFSYRH